MHLDRPHISGMRQILAPITLCLTLSLVVPAPVLAQDAQSDRDEGLSLMERGMRLLLDGFIQEMEPALDEMAKAMEQLEPMAKQLAALIGDVQYYEQPERLENGDIIIRRKADAPPPPDLPIPDPSPSEPAPKGQVDL